jgi:two-component system LytT family response regulator
MLKIVIIDDEKNVIIVIKKLLSLINIAHTVVSEAASVQAGLEVIKQTNPDVVLLDIELEDGTGFDLLNQLDEIDFKLIFITAFNEYAIKAFKFNALDYILKPIDPDDLKNAINKAKDNLYTENTLKLLLNNLETNKTAETQKLIVKTTERTYFIPIDEIFYFQSDGSYSKIVSKDLTILASKNLKYFQEILPKHQFIRTHQSFLVNKLNITSLKNNTILLNNSVEIPISVRRKSEIKKLLGK